MSFVSLWNLSDTVSLILALLLVILSIVTFDLNNLTLRTERIFKTWTKLCQITMDLKKKKSWYMFWSGKCRGMRRERALNKHQNLRTVFEFSFPFDSLLHRRTLFSDCKIFWMQMWWKTSTQNFAGQPRNLSVFKISKICLPLIQ